MWAFYYFLVNLFFLLLLFLIVVMQVYDVTTFLEDHPGGEDVLLDASGV